MSAVTEDDVLTDAYRTEFAATASSWRAAVGAELQRIEETCARAGAGQLEAVRIWRGTHLWLNVTAILSAGVAGSLMLASSGRPVIAGALALAAAMLTTFAGMVSPARRERQTAEAAQAYQAVESLARQARQVDLPGHRFEEARAVLGELTRQWQTVDRDAVPVLRTAQRRADKTVRPVPSDEPASGRVNEVVRIFRVWPRPADQLS